ncbi:MAG: BACON domain-containing carbohydrate-binding protein [Saprospiraceae bacterium]
MTSNCTDWNITSDQTWLTASPSSGSGNATISFNITENVGLQARSGTLTISGCGQTQVVNISQAGAATVLSVSPTFLNLSETQGNASFSITANCNWTITNIPNWMTVTPTMGNGNMLVNITYTENTSTQPRTATLTIIGCGTDQQLPITQTGCSLPPAPNLGQSGTITVCPNEPVPLTANACSGCTVVWSNNQTGNSITVTSEGTYQAYASNSCGQSQWSGSVTVEYHETPSLTTISATGPTDNLCNGETVQLIAGNVCTGCTVVWSDGQVGNPIMGMAGITYTAYVLENECELQSGNSNEIELTLASVPPMADIEPNGGQTICEGETIELTVQNVCTDCTVLWSTGSTEPVITVSSEGIYTATLLNKCDVQGLISDAVNVIITPAAPMAQVTPVGPIDGCIGQTITLTVSGCPTCNVQWSNNEAGPVMTTTISGAFTATYSNECGDALPSNEVVVNLTEYVPEITVNNECYLAAPNGSNHQWLFNGNPIATGQFFTAEETGYYSLAMTNNVGCTGTSEPLFIDGCATPVKEIGALTSLNVYPNPVESTAYFSLTLNQPLYLQIDLLTTDGRFLQNVFDDEMQIGETTVSTDVSKLSTGVYLFQIISENGVRMGRLVVTK